MRGALEQAGLEELIVLPGLGAPIQGVEAEKVIAPTNPREECW